MLGFGLMILLNGRGVVLGLGLNLFVRLFGGQRFNCGRRLHVFVVFALLFGDYLVGHLFNVDIVNRLTRIFVLERRVIQRVISPAVCGGRFLIAFAFALAVARIYAGH